MHVSLDLQTKQQLTISPQLQQAIRLLQLSTLELQAEIDTIVESNPLLELEEPFSMTAEVEPKSLSVRQSHDLMNEKQLSQSESLSDHLLSQLRLLKIDARTQLIAIAIIDALNIDGYLSCDLNEIIQTLSLNDTQIDLPGILPALALVQTLDPPGVGARNLQEALLLQLEHHASLDKFLATQIVESHFEALISKDFQSLKPLSANTNQLKRALDLIKQLNPRPGSMYANVEQYYVTPDVSAYKENETWHVILNPKLKGTTPKLNHETINLLKENPSEVSATYLRKNLTEAKWLINSVESRNNTLLKVAHAIVKHQTPFFERGELSLKPLRLQDIAKVIDMHESTVSRITTQKYIHTPHGIFELKYFFPSHISTATGIKASSTAIQALIKKIITEEDASKPLSDNAIMNLLKQKGINAARRTITKYRESMQIPSSPQRKVKAL